MIRSGIKRTLSKTAAIALAVATMLSFSACGKTGSSEVSGAQTSEIQTSAQKTDIVAKRTISVEEVNGTVNASDGSVTVTLLQGEHLESGRTVSTDPDSDLTLLLDSDKHVYAGEETLFNLVAEGGEKSTKTRFELERGLLKSIIDNPLGSDESYEVDTPNATMSVRGTTFTVRVADVKGKIVTIVDVEEGKVEITAADGSTEFVNPGETKEITGAGVKDANLSGRFRLYGVRMSQYIDGQLFNSTYEECAYDSDGLLRGAYTESNGVRTSFYDYTYPAGDKPEQKVYHKTGGELIYVENYEYDSEGNKIRMTRERDYDGLMAEEDYKYDQYGNLIEKVYNQYKPYHLEGRIQYTYDGEGRILTEDEYGIDGSMVNHIAYTYDEKGRLIDYRDQNLNTGRADFYNEIKTDYKFDALGREVEYTWYQCNEFFSASDSEADVLICRTDYDVYGNKTKLTIIIPDSGEVTGTYEYTYEEVE